MFEYVVRLFGFNFVFAVLGWFNFDVCIRVWVVLDLQLL